MPDRTLQDVIRKNIRRLRLKRQLRQEEVAAMARRFGVPWSQATIAAIERGTRKVALEEGYILMTVLDVPMAELLAAGADESIDVAGMEVEGADLVDWAKGEPVVILTSGSVEPSLSAARQRRLSPLAGRYGLDADHDTLARLASVSLRPVDQKASRALGVWTKTRGAFEIAAAAESLWGKGLQEARDERYQQIKGYGGDARARRGHVTRQLLDELRAHIKAVRTSGGRAKGKKR